jgi:hypothetical protein
MTFTLWTLPHCCNHVGAAPGYVWLGANLEFDLAIVLRTRTTAQACRPNPQYIVNSRLPVDAGGRGPRLTGYSIFISNCKMSYVRRICQGDHRGKTQKQKKLPGEPGRGGANWGGARIGRGGGRGGVGRGGAGRAGRGWGGAGRSMVPEGAPSGAGEGCFKKFSAARLRRSLHFAPFPSPQRLGSPEGLRTVIILYAAL